jgi:hypothetical protein
MNAPTELLRPIIGIENRTAQEVFDIMCGRFCALPASEAGWRDSQAAIDVLAERLRQIEAEGWTPEHDDKHTKGEMAKAAACYAAGYPIATLWPWGDEWWKFSDRRRNLVKAGALILAEIERLDRLSSAPDRRAGE